MIILLVQASPGAPECCDTEQELRPVLLVLSAASILFLAEQRKRLRELPDGVGSLTLEQVTATT